MIRSVPGRTPRIQPDTWIDPDELKDVLRNATNYVELWRRDYGEGRSRTIV